MSEGHTRTQPAECLTRTPAHSRTRSIARQFGPEYARSCGIEALEPLGIFLPGRTYYPGGALFDPLRLSDDPSAFGRCQIAEIKHARLAMVAWIVFAGLAAARLPIFWWR